MWILIIAKNIKQLNETHLLKYRYDRKREREMLWLLTAKYIKQFDENSPPKAQTRQEEKKEIHGGYLQPNISNNSMKTHPLKHRHERRREKKYMVVIHYIYIYIKQFN